MLWMIKKPHTYCSCIQGELHRKTGLKFRMNILRTWFGKKNRCNSNANFFIYAGIINCMNRLRNDRLCNSSAEKHLGVLADNQCQTPVSKAVMFRQKISIILMCTESVMCKPHTFCYYCFSFFGYLYLIHPKGLIST